MKREQFIKLTKHIEDTYGIDRGEYNKIHQWIKYRYGKADRPINAKGQWCEICINYQK